MESKLIIDKIQNTKDTNLYGRGLIEIEVLSKEGNLVKIILKGKYNIKKGRTVKVRYLLDSSGKIFLNLILI